MSARRSLSEVWVMLVVALCVVALAVLGFIVCLVVAFHSGDEEEEEFSPDIGPVLNDNTYQ